MTLSSVVLAAIVATMSGAGASAAAPPGASPPPAGRPAAQGPSSAATSWKAAKQDALDTFVPPPPATVTLTANGTGSVTGASYHTFSVTAVVKIGPTRQTSCPIVGELLVPDNATGSAPEPAIVSTNGFGGAWTSSTSLGPAEMAVSKDYVALTYSGLGFGGSGCQIELDSPTWDGLAASELISWLGDQREVTRTPTHRDDPIVGMVGGSYGGGVQFSAAEIDPRIDAIVPVITWNDLGFSLAPNNETNGTAGLARQTTEPGALKWEWDTLFFGDGAATPLEHPTHPSPSTCPDFAPTICTAYISSVALGYPDRSTVTMLRHDSMVDFYRKLHLPVLLAQGENDTLFTIREAVANYRELKSDGDPVTLVLQSWGHSDSTPAPGEFTYTPPFTDYENVLVADFFARWLRGDTAVTTGAPIQYFRDWVTYSGNAAPAYGSATSWPVGRTTSLYLSQPSTGGALVPSASSVVGGTQTFVNPPGGIGTSYSETSFAQGTAPLSTIPPTDPPGTFATWESAPLRSAVDVVGVPHVTVSMASSVPAGVDTATDPVIYAKLYQVAPTGAVTLVHRLVAPVRVADTASPVTIDLPGIVHQFPAGDRLELVLAAGDDAYLGNRTADTYTVTVTTAHPSILRLPVVPAAEQEAAALPSGD